jgi:hypothetical protein
MSWMNDKDGQLPFVLQEILLKVLEDTKWEPPKSGPNEWSVKQDERGEHFDYELYDQGDETVIYPVCHAALHWLYRHLPEDCPRWQAQGFKVETKYVKQITDGMYRDGLLSEDDFVTAMSVREQEYGMANDVEQGR